MEIVTAIVTPVVESLMVPLKKHILYLISCTKYMKDMGTKMEKLKTTRLSVEHDINYNKSNNLEVPTEVEGWLKEVRKIDAEVESIPCDVGNCFNLKGRHKLGRKTFKIIQDINNLMKEKSSIEWTNHPIPLGKVDSMKASTSTPSTHHNDFKSREPVFLEAIKALQPHHKSHMIALCGMGGVGKTIMMQKLKKVASEKKMFDFIIEVAIGEKMEVSIIQQAVADFLGIELKESSEVARAIKLQKSFEAHSDGGKKKFLVMLDDVWQLVDLNDIGLSPLPNQGVDFKVLLTSRNRGVCIMMGVELNSIINVNVIDAPEAQSFFAQCVKISDDDDLDLDLRKIGDDIAIRCHGLPIAIKTIAHTLKGTSKPVWIDTLSKIEHKDIDKVVQQIFSMSYENLDDEETRSTLLLCGLFPEDFDTPTEDLMRYGWGLRLFRRVETIREARNRVNSCIERLVHANLLIHSQIVGCVKMHDLVRVFVLDKCSVGEHASVVGNMPKWPTKYNNESCKRISLECMGMPEFPRDCKYPNLSLLKLMHGDESLKFPEDFYEEMRKLEVIAYESMEYPLHLRSLQCSTNLRTLCLNKCLLIFDRSLIGDLLNLEVLSFAYSSIYQLPSTIGNLKKLKVLDLTDCIGLRIDDGIFKKLVKLEELYMRGVRRRDDANGDELVDFSKDLDALEIEFFIEYALPKHMSFEKLERFKISLGCQLDENKHQNKYSFENTLKLETTKCELLDYRMNELFEKTKVLHLQIEDINDFGDSLGESLHHQQCSFSNVRVLHISSCENLVYLFTIHVANGLKQLEDLNLSQCPLLETLVDSENCEVEVIRFPSLKFLSLHKLPMLMSLCKGDNVLELPQLEKLKLDSLPNFISIYQHFLEKEVMSSKLKKMKIHNMEKLKEIWPSQLSNNDKVIRTQFREIRVEGCDSLVNLFPSNPMSLLHHLEKLAVSKCGSIDVLFNLDLGSCAGDIEDGSTNRNLRSITVSECGELREVWRVKGVNNSNDDLPILDFQNVECIEITKCKSLRNLFIPTSSNFNMKALTQIILDVHVWEEHKMVESSQKEEIIAISDKDISEMDNDTPDVAFPSYLIHTFHQLRTLDFCYYKGAEVAFEMESSSCRKLTTRNNQRPLVLPFLEDLKLHHMERMTHVWKYDWNRFSISQREPKSSFHNLTSINLSSCKLIKYLFSPFMAKLLSNLNSIYMYSCDAIEEVVSNVDDEVAEIATSISSHTNNTTFFPHLDHLDLWNMNCLKCIDGVGAKYGGNKLASDVTVHERPHMGVAYRSFCKYLKTIRTHNCYALLNVIPSHAVGRMPKLEKLEVIYCTSLREIFEIEGVNDTHMGDGTTTIPRLTGMPTLLELPNLKKLKIVGCGGLKYILTSSTLGSLKQLEELEISFCSGIEVIVKEEDNGLIASKDVVFPRLKSLTLVHLLNLKSFFLGKNDFWWPLLDKVEIYCCWKMMIFTSGRSMTPKLKYINTGLGKHSLQCGLNFDWTNAPHQNQLYSFSWCSEIVMLLQFPWSFSNLIELEVDGRSGGWRDRKTTIFTCKDEVQCFGNIEEGAHDELLETQSVDMILISNKKQAETSSSSCIWKTNWWTSSNLSSLTKLSIKGFDYAQHVFSYSTAASLLQLQELHISYCYGIKAIVEQMQDSEKKANEISFPCLKSLKLKSLDSLEGFCLGSEAFQWPSLDTLTISGCYRITVFTKGQSTAPKLKVIKTTFGWCEAMEDLNSFIKTKIQEWQANPEDTSSSHYVLSQPMQPLGQEIQQGLKENVAN